MSLESTEIPNDEYSEEKYLPVEYPESIQCNNLDFQVRDAVDRSEEKKNRMNIINRRSKMVCDLHRYYSMSNSSRQYRF